MKGAVAIVAVLVATGALAAQPKAQPWLGMSIRSHQDSSGERFLHVERIVAGGAADRAGIVPGDIVTTFAGASLRFTDDLDVLTYLGERKPGERLSIRIVRAGEVRSVVVIVGVMPESSRVAWERAIQVARRKRLAAQGARQ